MLGGTGGSAGEFRCFVCLVSGLGLKSKIGRKEKRRARACKSKDMSIRDIEALDAESIQLCWRR